MTDQTQQPTQPVVQAEPVRLSEKVTTTLLDRMYNNFVKITDWVMKGKESKYPMPKALAGLFNTTESNAKELVELKQLVTTLQQNLIEKEQRLGEAQSRITALDGALQKVNTTLANFISRLEQGDISAMNSQVVTGVAPQTQNPVAPEPVEVVDELVDLDEVVSGNEDIVTDKQPSAQVSPNERAVQVSAAAVGAGNIDPASYAALDAEIGALLG